MKLSLQKCVKRQANNKRSQVEKSAHPQVEEPEYRKELSLELVVQPLEKEIFFGRKGGKNAN